MTRFKCVSAGFIFLLLIAMGPVLAEDTRGVAYEFNKDGDLEGWGGTHSVTPLKVLGGTLQCIVTGDDPYFESPHFFWVNATENPVVLICLKTVKPGMCQIYWDTDTEPNMDEEKMRVFWSGEANEWKIYVLNMAGHSKWMGGITQLRIDPPESAGKVEIDFVRICSVTEIPAILSIDSFSANDNVVPTSGKPFNVTARITNTGSQSTLNIQAMLSTPSGLVLQGSPAVQTIPELASGEGVDLVWTLSSTGEVTGTLQLSVAVDGYAPSSSLYYVYVRASAQVPGGEELLVNGGFEEGTINGWTVEGANSAWYDSSPSSSRAYNGTYNVYIDPYDHGNIVLYQNIYLHSASFELSFAVLPHHGYSPGDPYHPRAVILSAYSSNNQPLVDSQGKTVELLYCLVGDLPTSGYKLNYDLELRDPDNEPYYYFVKDFAVDYVLAGGNPLDWNKADYIKLSFTSQGGGGGTNWDAFSIKELPHESKISFILQGIKPDFQGAVLTLDGINYKISQMPAQISSNTQHSFSWKQTLEVKNQLRYNWASTSGLSESREGIIDISNTNGTIIASYKVQYYIDVQQSRGGSITPAGGMWINQSDNIQLIAKPDECYHYVKWTATGLPLSEVSNPSITLSPDGSGSVTAIFEDTMPPTLSIESPINGGTYWIGGIFIGGIYSDNGGINKGSVNLVIDGVRVTSGIYVGDKLMFYDARFSLGTHVAQLTVEDLGGNVVTATSTFTVIPVEFIVIPVVIGVAVILSIWRLKYMKKMRRQDQGHLDLV
ncbi:MAG: hypothetical protein NTY03_03460 [Candidatus Bathyarchaeota archaeon]|nr:hypothetical protein [Candidatus Bathyarchaeota archaeon]